MVPGLLLTLIKPLMLTLVLMPHEFNRQNRHAQDYLSEDEIAHLVERLVDRLLDPTQPWSRKCILEGLKRPEQAKWLAREIGLPDDVHDTAWAKQFEISLQRRNRKRLIELLKAEFVRSPIPRGCETTVLSLGDPAILRKGMLEIAKRFSGKPGRKPLIEESEYQKLAAMAGELYPVILKLLQELDRGTKRTVRDLLEFWQLDHPTACGFLLRNLPRLQEGLNARVLPRPAKKLPTRARVLSEALAGTEYGLTLSTSIERVRQGKRALKVTLPP